MQEAILGGKIPNDFEAVLDRMVEEEKKIGLEASKTAADFQSARV